MAGEMSDAAPPSRASVLTAAGRGAIAVVAAEGPAALAAVDAHFRAANGKPLAAQTPGRVVFGQWHDRRAAWEASQPGSVYAEDVIVCRTDDGGLEVHCHGGVAAPERILEALGRAGCQRLTWQQWLRRHATDALEAEADVALAAATTRRTAAVLLDQRGGALRAAVAAARQALAEGRPDDAHRQLSELLARAPLGLHLTQPWQVAVAGRPNVGKSSLVNALVGYERAIVFNQPGTTRDVLAAETAVDGWPVRLTDAAGLRAAADPLEAEGVALAQQRLGRADLVAWVLDAMALSPVELADPHKTARRELAAEAPEAAGAVNLLAVVNKIDLAAPNASTPAGAVLVSALTGAGMPALLSALSQRLVPRLPSGGDPMPFTARQVDRLAAATTAIEGCALARAVEHLDQLVGGD
jgi:tRNA modification GTPase